MCAAAAIQHKNIDIMQIEFPSVTPYLACLQKPYLLKFTIF